MHTYILYLIYNIKTIYAISRGKFLLLCLSNTPNQLKTDLHILSFIWVTIIWWFVG